MDLIHSNYEPDRPAVLWNGIWAPIINLLEAKFYGEEKISFYFP